ncbi:MAG: hypothetical protein QOI16_1900 [Pseudonocardiales bacterium]|jgi:hypothetical protein|nr:hypothetical protein [Pseudonocardiales bacterium]
MTRNLQQTWRTALVVVIAALYAWVGVSLHGADQLLGLIGAPLIVTAVAVAPRSRPTAAGLLLLGALPLAMTTWWSVVTPLLAVLCLLLGWPLRSRTSPADPTLP